MYETKTGDKRYISEIVAESVFFRPPKDTRGLKQEKPTTTPPVSDEAPPEAIHRQEEVVNPDDIPF